MDELKAHWKAIEETLEFLRERFENEAAKAVQQTVKTDADAGLIDLTRNRVKWLRGTLWNLHNTLWDRDDLDSDQTLLRLSGNFKSLCVARTIAKDIPRRAFDLLAVHERGIKFGTLKAAQSYALVFRELGTRHFLALMEQSRTPCVSPLVGSHSAPHRDRDEFYLSVNDQTECLFDVDKLPAIRDAVKCLIPPPVGCDVEPPTDVAPGPNGSYTIAQLIADKTSIRVLNERADKQHAQAGMGPFVKGTPEAHWFMVGTKTRYEAGTLATQVRTRFGVDRIQASCEAKTGRFDCETIRQIRAELCLANNLSLDEVNAMPIGVFADLATGRKKTSKSATKARGRKPDTDPKADERIHRAWKSGKHQTYDDLARELGTTRREIERAIDRHRKRSAKG